ncbi:class I SAM-dependent methyltransferase [Actinomadura sp. HBU206391]|uniref:class I SAM-dependent methyltransferase n=1 Tax=Actinomadura sp. HBU206391 TaxID=2731692 RepID=UPI00164EF7DB|nr:class I SAM-dependent methyltransferase [Actinomadura sp. HBU206391]MBC6460034.1 class I SAM-dependent methyltransferase [Actinomadura sp. HBU206391]
MDWMRWHDDYDRPGSPLARRLQVVREQIGTALDRSPSGPLRVVSLCAGQGRDLLDVLAVHPRRDDVRGRLVELDADNAAYARQSARAAGLHQIEVVTADAAITDHYRGMVPADLVLICGVFGNLTDEDIESTIASCPQLCGTGGTVIWTRDRSLPDRVPLICEWFAEHGFDQRWVSEPDAGFGVGVHRFTGRPQPLASGMRMFTFVGFDVLSRMDAPADGAG